MKILTKGIHSQLLRNVAVVAAMTLPLAANATEVSREVIFAANADDVWAAIGPFCAIADWHPGLESCMEEQINGVTHRRLVAKDGAHFLEKLIAHDNSAMKYSYTIEEGPLPVADYSATISVSQSDGETHVVWSGTFEPKGVSEAEAVDVMNGVYDAGLNWIRQSFAN